MNKPVEFKHRLQSHPAIINLQLLFEKPVSWKIVIAKVVLSRNHLQPNQDQFYLVNTKL